MWWALAVVVLRVGDAWLVGVGKRAPHGFQCSCLVSPYGSLDRLKSLYTISSTLNSKRQTKHCKTEVGQGRAGRSGSEMWGVLLVPSSSPTLWLINDGLDVNVVSNVTWFHLNHDMVPRRIYKLSFYGGHSITLGHPVRNSRRCRSPANQWMSTKYPELERGSKMRWRLFETNENETKASPIPRDYEA